MKYFIYCRKSSEDKKKQIQSIDDQKKELTALARARGLAVEDIITDEKSAKAPGRKGFSRMLDRLQKGEANGLLCWKLDRLARNPVDGGSISWLLQRGIIAEIITPDKVYFPTDNVILTGIEFGMANQYILDLSKNVKRGLNSKIEKGWLPTKAPLGYVNEKKALKGEKRIFPDPLLFPVLRNLWKLLLSQKYSLMGLYRYMKENCPIYRQGRLLAFSSFDRIFHNPFYAGLFKWNGALRLGSHKPMITQREFEDSQIFLGQGPALREKELHFDLKGLFRCGYCGALITAERHSKFVKKTGEKKHFDYYRCVHRKGEKDCREKPLSTEKINRHILEFIESSEIPEEIIRFGLEELNRLENKEEETIKEKQIKQEISKLGKSIQTAISNITTEPDPEIRGFMKARINELQIQKKGLEEDLRKVQREKQNPHAEIKTALDFIRQAKTIFLHGSAEQKKDIVRGLGSNWILKGQKLYCEPHFSALALQKAKKFHEGVKYRIEPAQTGFHQGKKAPADLAACVWSYLWELIREKEDAQFYPASNKIFQIQKLFFRQVLTLVPVF